VSSYVLSYDVDSYDVSVVVSIVVVVAVLVSVPVAVESKHATNV